MEVPPERSNAFPKGLLVSSVGLHIILPGGLRFPRIIKLSPEVLNISSGGIRFKYYT